MSERQTTVVLRAICHAVVPNSHLPDTCLPSAMLCTGRVAFPWGETPISLKSFTPPTPSAEHTAAAQGIFVEGGRAPAQP